MKTRIFTMLLAGTALLSSCSKEIDDDPQLTDGNRVVFTLGGAVTRAAGDNDSATPTAATAAEKKIESLLAVVFGEDGSYYKTFETNYSDADQTASFDLGKNGTYDIHFVANADETLKAAVMTLTDQNSDTNVTDDDLLALIASQEVGKKDNEEAWHPFLMLSTEAAHVVSKAGVVTDGGQVIMRRLAVRIDLVNAAEGVIINSVKFINRTKQSRLGASNDMNFSTEGDLYEEKTYDNIDLAGDFDVPTEYKTTIYSYENVDVTPGGAHLPALEIKYTMDGMKFTHTVTFMDSKDETGKTPLALKRNYLYRIVLTKPLDLDFDIIVDDWNTAEAFQVDDLPFETFDQDALNAKLKVNMFTEYNVKTLDPVQKKVTFFTEQTTTAEPTSYFSYTWLSGQDPTGSTSSNGINTTDLRNETLTDDDGNHYRIPTTGECNLLLPNWTEANDREMVEGKGQVGIRYLMWNDNETSTNGLITMTTPFTETIYLEDGEDCKPNTTAETIEGESQFKIGKLTEVVELNSKTYNIHPVYGIRFKGTTEYSAYRWEYCSFAGNSTERYLSIKIKALPQDSKLTVDDITDNASFWHDGYIELKFPASGYYTSSSASSSIFYNGTICFYWSKTIYTKNDSYGKVIDFTAFHASIGQHQMEYNLPVRLVKVSE